MMRNWLVMACLSAMMAFLLAAVPAVGRPVLDDRDMGALWGGCCPTGECNWPWTCGTSAGEGCEEFVCKPGFLNCPSVTATQEVASCVEDIFGSIYCSYPMGCGWLLGCMCPGPPGEYLYRCEGDGTAVHTNDYLACL